MKSHVIIGNSGAGVSAVQAIRQVTTQDRITLLSRENCAAYSPVLTTYYLAGNISYSDMFFCDETFYKQNNVNTMLGNEAVKIEPDSKKVVLENGGSVEYDDLLIATGSSSLIPAIDGVSLPGVFTLYTADEARKLSDAMERAGAVAIVGAGLIGMQTLSAVSGKGKKIILIEMMDQVLPNILDREGAKILEQRLQKEGVELHLKDRVARIAADGKKKVVSLSSGARVEADVVVMAVGVAPNVKLLQGSGVKVSRGVVIDEYCRTSVEGIYAAGDAAEGTDAITGERRVNATWPNAIEQGTVAGLNMAGKNVTGIRKLRFNAFTLFGLPCASVGLVRAEAGDVKENVRRNSSVYRKLLYKDGLLAGAVLFGDIEDAGILANLIERRTSFSEMNKVSSFHMVPYPYVRTLK